MDLSGVIFSTTAAFFLGGLLVAALGTVWIVRKVIQLIDTDTISFSSRSSTRNNDKIDTWGY